MEEALYHPERGYYPRREPRADFYTAPELHPAFAAVLARQIEKRLPLGGRVVEMGAGEGLLASQLMARLPGVPYVAVERAAAVTKAPGARVLRSIEELEPGPGVFLSNELVDAFPVHVLEKKNGVVHELYVDQDGSEKLGPLSDERLRVDVDLQEGERHAVNVEASLWMRQIARAMTAGAVITLDYGKRFGAAPNPPRAFYRHSRPESLTARPGEQDLTASVDFDTLIGVGERLGLKTEFYGTLSRFLLDGGIGDFLPQGDSVADLRARAQIKTLLHPEGMGETFKVLVQTRKEGNPS